MSLVQVFNDSEKAHIETIKLTRSYNSFIREIEKRYKSKDQQYRKSTCYNEKSLEAQKRHYKEEFGEDTDISQFLINPEIISIPDEAIIEISKDLGKDLNINLVFGLKSHKPGYSFNYCFINNDPIGFLNEPCDDIQQLVLDVRTSIKKVSDGQYGASTIPIFYTIREDQKMSREEADGIEGFLNQFLEINTDGKSKQELAQAKESLSSIDFTKTINTGLSDEEIAEFERLYLEH